MATTSCDQFGLWLGSSGILNTLNHTDLSIHKDKIFEILGGMKAMIKICLSHLDNITLQQHQQLFHLLSDIHRDKSKLDIDDNTQQIQSLQINDISICNIFTFLSATDHQNLQQTSRQFAIIGRYRESYVINPETKTYIHFGQHLELIHKLKHFMHELYSNDSKKQINALKVMSNYIGDKKMENNEMIIVKTGIISTLIEWATSTSTNTLVFISIFQFLVSFQYQWNINKYAHSICDAIMFHIKNNSVMDKCIGQYIDPISLLVYNRGDYIPKQKIHPDKVEELTGILVQQHILEILVNGVCRYELSDYFDAAIDVISSILYHDTFDAKATNNADILNKLLQFILRDFSIETEADKIHRCNDHDDDDDDESVCDESNESDEDSFIPVNGLCANEMIRICIKIHKGSDLKIDINDADIVRHIKMLMLLAKDPELALDIDLNLLHKQQIIDIYDDHYVIDFAMKCVQNDEIFKVLMVDKTTDYTSLIMSNCKESVVVCIKMLQLKTFPDGIYGMNLWDLIAKKLNINNNTDIVRTFMDWDGDKLLLEYIDYIWNEDYVESIDQHYAEIRTIVTLLKAINHDSNGKLSNIGDILSKTNNFDESIIVIYGNERMELILYKWRYHWFNDFLNAIMKHDPSMMTYLAKFESLKENIGDGRLNWQWGHISQRQTD